MNLSDDINDFCFFDFETRAEPYVSGADANVTTAGTHRYAKRSFAVILTYAIGDAPVREISLDAGFNGDWLCWPDMPADLIAFYKRAFDRKAWFAAWKTSFDRQVWNEGCYAFPLLEPEMTIDVMAQAVASNLPAKLEGASRFIGRGGKQDDGKALIAMFSTPNGYTPQSHPEEWARFKSYAVRDTDELRAVFKATRQLPRAEWEQYWASERINDRGIGVDVEFCRRAAAVAKAEVGRSNRALARLTNGRVTAVTQTKRIAEWACEVMPSVEGRELLEKEWDEGETEEDEKTVSKLSISRARIEAVLVYLEARGDRGSPLHQVLTIRQFGGSSSPAKFQKMVDQHDGGRLKEQYVFNGAQQTGRFSSRGVQIHNLPNRSLGELEETAIEMINDLEDVA